MKDSNKYKITVGAFLSAIIPMIVALVSIRFWEVDFSVPASFGSDNALGMILMKSISQNGIMGAWINQYMGAPELSALVDTPFLDLSFTIEAWIISLFFKEPATILYIIYIVSYMTVGLFSYLLVLRKIISDNITRIIGAVMISLLPYHFLRGMGHGTLSRYSVIAIAIYLCICVNEEEFSYGVPSRYSICKRIFYWALCLLVGISNIYYAFGALLCLVMTVVSKGIRKKISILWNEAITIYIILIGVLVGLFPKIYFNIKYGVNDIAGVRIPQESEIYALKIIQLLLPCSYNRIDVLRNIYVRYTQDAFNINENTYASLGLLATIGFLCTCLWIIIQLSKTDSHFGINRGRDRYNLFSLLILVLILYSVGGGVGTIVAYVLTPEIRCLNRFSVFIAFISICVLTMLVDELIVKTLNNYKVIIVRLVIMLVLGVALYSEIPIWDKGWQDENIEKNETMVNFFQDVQDLLKDDAMVYQLPYMDFPESYAPGNMTDYEHGYAYVYTNNIRWSYGAMKGRHTRAAELFIDSGMSYSFIDGIKEEGFDAVYIDTAGYEDGGEAIIDFYSIQLGLQPLVSEDGRLYFYLLCDNEN